MFPEFTIYMPKLSGTKAHMFTEIEVWKTDEPESQHFGGDAMWQWEAGSWKADMSRDHIRNHGETLNRSEWLYNSLAETNQKLLRGQFVVVVKMGDPEYDKVSKLWDMNPHSDALIFETCGGIL